MRKILITNDDGITADGIVRLANAAKKYGQVWVVAPADQCSAMSHKITLRQPFTAHPHDFPVEDVTAIAVDGTPADCVRIGCRNIVPGGPDVIFAGINFGYNCATDLQYSATVGAAMEGSFQGVHSIAFSEGMNGEHSVTDAYLDQLIAELIDKPLGPGKIWNVNFPNCKLAEYKGILRDRTVSDKAPFDDYYDETPLPDGGITYIIRGEMHKVADEGTDYRALLDHYISIGIANNIGY